MARQLEAAVYHHSTQCPALKNTIPSLFYTSPNSKPGGECNTQFFALRDLVPDRESLMANPVHPSATTLIMDADPYGQSTVAKTPSLPSKGATVHPECTYAPFLNLRVTRPFSNVANGLGH